MKNKILKDEIKVILISGLLTFILLNILFYIRDLAPYGNKSLAIYDANVQYIDLFSYYKDVLFGKNSFLYSFSKTLGGSTIAIFSYYLTSPFNFLMIFFDGLNIHVFFDLLIILKLSLISMTFAYFAINRFKKVNKNNLIIYILLSLSYALSQYTISQSFNIMWLDNVYMLPLTVLQVYYLVNGKKNWNLSMLIGLSIILNWYTALINCIFIVLSFIFEYSLVLVDKEIDIKVEIIDFLKTLTNFILSILTGLFLASALFLPTLSALTKSSRGGQINLKDLINFNMCGNISSAFQNYTYGATSNFGSVALFCGSFAIILCIAIFFNKNLSLNKRIVIGNYFFLNLIIFYFYPFITIFSLLKYVGSYWYRYSYVSIFAIIYIALYSYISIRKKEEKQNILIVSIIYSISLFTFFYLNHINDNQYAYLNAFIIYLIALLYYIYENIKSDNKSTFWDRNKGNIYMTLFIILNIFDLLINANILLKKYSEDINPNYKNYINSQRKLISNIKEKDEDFYRISQTTTRTTNQDNLTANYNEALSYNYASISGYTSSPDDNQRYFLDKLGYPINGENMCITNASILGVDSLLGVKYILSPYYINGLEKSDFTASENKIIYKNPYALPMAFVYTVSEKKIIDDFNDPFKYQNEIYQKIFGIKDNIYKPVKFNVLSKEENENLKIEIDNNFNPLFPIYGHIPFNSWQDASIYLNKQFLTKYACWTAPKVFYLPCEQNINMLELSANEYDYDFNNLQFYALDLDTLRECSEKANLSKVEDIIIKNGFVKATIPNGKEGENLFLSIAKDDAWDIRINGKKAEYELIGDCLYSIKLVNGVNNLRMVYHTKGLKSGILISLCTILFILFDTIKNKKNSKNSSKGGIK